MREERGQLAGPLLVYEDFTLWGSIVGDVKVVEGGRLWVRGAIYGDMEVQRGGRVHVYGNVTGTLVVAKRAKVIVSGVIGGDAINNGGRLFIDARAKVFGNIKTRAGETTVDTPKTSQKERDMRGDP